MTFLSRFLSFFLSSLHSDESEWRATGDQRNGGGDNGGQITKINVSGFFGIFKSNDPNGRSRPFAFPFFGGRDTFDTFEGKKTWVDGRTDG